ncbi:uncharacterized protein [Aegilops tauschii subsp. strangulata]|uniref:uncharacterized protein isoform X1 n=1 Tax=Aegilops tauschii subsp. strangulata TaxID=200361 RepID=UPI003CC88F10
MSSQPSDQAPSAADTPAPPHTSSPASDAPAAAPVCRARRFQPQVFSNLSPAGRPVLDLAAAPTLGLSAEVVPGPPPVFLRSGELQIDGRARQTAPVCCTAPPPAGSPPSSVLTPAPAASIAHGMGGWLACFSNAGPVSSSPTAVGGAGRESDLASDGLQLVSSRRGPRGLPPAPAPARRPLPAWMAGRCCRCLAPGHRAALCRDPFRCSHYLRPGHRARGCKNAWRPLSSLSPQRRPVAAPPRPHAHGAAAPQVPARGWPTPQAPQAQVCHLPAPAVPQPGVTSGIGVIPAAPELQMEAALGSTCAAVVWLAGAQSSVSCQAAAEALASVIGARAADVKVVCKPVQQSGVVDIAECSRNQCHQRRSPSSPTSVLPSQATSPKDGSGLMLLLHRDSPKASSRIASPVRASSSCGLTPERPPGFEASSDATPAAVTAPTPLSDVHSAPNITVIPPVPTLAALKIRTPSRLAGPLLSSSCADAGEDRELPPGLDSYYTPATSPLARDFEVSKDWPETLTPLFADGSPARTPLPPRRGDGRVLSGSLSPVSSERVLADDALFVPAQSPLISTAPTPPPANRNRRKTFAVGYTVRRSSIRIKSSRRGMPIAKMAERNLCRRLGIVDGAEQVTEHAIDEFVCMFKQKLPSTAVAALRALFRLDCEQAGAMEEALMRRGGQDALDQEVHGDDPVS